MEWHDFRRICAVLATVALCAAAVPADGARPPQERRQMFMNDGEQIVVALAEREGMTGVIIVGTFSFFSCSYGCRRDEDVILFTARDPRSGRVEEHAVCYDDGEQRIRLPLRQGFDPSCSYDSAPESVPANAQEGS